MVANLMEAAAGAAAEHRNLVPLRGYYYSKDEKLLVVDYLPGGSLSARLHGESSIELAYQLPLLRAVKEFRPHSGIRPALRAIRPVLQSSPVFVFANLYGVLCLAVCNPLRRFVSALLGCSLLSQARVLLRGRCAIGLLREGEAACKVSETVRLRETKDMSMR